MKWLIVIFQLLMSVSFLLAIAGGTMDNVGNTIAVVYIILSVLTVVHVARAGK